MTTNASTDCYAVRKVNDLAASLAEKFDTPDVQETLASARENYLTQSIAMNEKASQLLTQKQGQSLKQ